MGRTNWNLSCVKTSCLRTSNLVPASAVATVKLQNGGRLYQLSLLSEPDTGPDELMIRRYLCGHSYPDITRARHRQHRKAGNEKWVKGTVKDCRKAQSCPSWCRFQRRLRIPSPNPSSCTSWCCLRNTARMLAQSRIRGPTER